jgi:catechol 2,3-dioxygenase-like lactoylglutathione lyase family enzyme
MIERPAHLGLRHVALFARAFDEMKRFYVDHLGFQVEWEPDPDNVYLTSGTDNLALHRAGLDHPSEDGRLDHLGLLVREPEDVDQWATYLDEQGVPFKARPRTHRDGARSLYLFDPDGNTIQIIHHPPISGRPRP